MAKKPVKGPRTDKKKNVAKKKAPKKIARTARPKKIEAKKKPPAWKRTSAGKIAEMMLAFRPRFDEILQAHRKLTRESIKSVLVIIGPRHPATRISFYPKLSLTPENATEALRMLGAPRYVIEQYLAELRYRHETDEKWNEEQKTRLSLTPRGHLWGERNSAALQAALSEEAGYMFPDISNLAFAKMVDGLAKIRGESINTLRSFFSKWRMMSEGDRNELLLRGGFGGAEYP